MKKIALIAGTRPEAIKVIPVYLALQKERGIEPVLIATGQHRDMLEDVFSIFACRPDISFQVMSHDQSLAGLTRSLLEVLEPLFREGDFAAILVQGDTTSAMAAGLVAFYNQIPLGHIEAGLRTNNILSPFPEEMNRRIVSLAARWHFAPTELAADNLLREQVSGKIFTVGNTVIDAALLIGSRVSSGTASLQQRLPFLDRKEQLHVLVTAHRRENFGTGIREICTALRKLAAQHPAIHFIFPVHPNPNVQQPIHEQLGSIDNIYLLEPLSYDQLLYVMKRALLVVTDSGGIQEEAPAFDVPVIVMRENTERPEGVDAGCSILAGTGVENIVAVFNDLIEEQQQYAAMAAAVNPYGQGNSAAQIARILADEV
jgi:UDP-N-acetylglucosamine 2-epimerase